MQGNNITRAIVAGGDCRLHRRWEHATTGLGQVVLLCGEAGIGKSRLVQVLKDHVTQAPHVRIEWRGSPYRQQGVYTRHLEQSTPWKARLAGLFSYGRVRFSPL